MVFKDLETKVAYKLFNLRKNGTLGSLFINRRFVLPIGVWLPAENYPTKGYALRPGWHVTPNPYAPHLSIKNRVWRMVEIKEYEELLRPESQGGMWWLAKWMRILDIH